MRHKQANSRTEAHPLAGGPREQLTLAVVGAGRAGGALASAARAAALEVRVAGRESALARCAGADAVLLCVPDSEIETACDAIATDPPAFVGHVSGATPLAALAAAARRGSETFSLHPLQTIPDPDIDLSGAPCAVTGASPRGLEFARALAGRLGLRPFAVADGDRALYHAAACIASNFLVALEESAADLLGRSGVEDAREVLAPLVLRTAANWADHGGEALTGPIARGDEATVSRHLDALARSAPDLLDLYRALAERTRRTATHTGAEENAG